MLPLFSCKLCFQVFFIFNGQSDPIEFIGKNTYLAVLFRDALCAVPELNTAGFELLRRAGQGWRCHVQ
jgi:hypothetical protein